MGNYWYFAQYILVSLSHVHQERLRPTYTVAYSIGVSESQWIITQSLAILIVASRVISRRHCTEERQSLRVAKPEGCETWGFIEQRSPSYRKNCWSADLRALSPSTRQDTISHCPCPRFVHVIIVVGLARTRRLNLFLWAQFFGWVVKHVSLIVDVVETKTMHSVQDMLRFRSSDYGNVEVSS